MTRTIRNTCALAGVAAGVVLGCNQISLQFVNTPPTANAGADQVVSVSNHAATASVTLDGSASLDPDGTIATFVWSEGNTALGQGASLTVTLSVGLHTITLTVIDAAGAMDSDTVEVLVRPSTSRVSINSSGDATSGGALQKASLSQDGSLVAFDSLSTTLVPGDMNGDVDVFVRNRSTSQTQRVSVDGNGNEASGTSTTPAISADGRFVAFQSDAPDLVPNDTNGVEDVFVYDRQTGAIQRVSVDNNGTEGNGASQNPSISANGRFVAFQSAASNLVANDTNGVVDIFVYDRQTNTIQRVSVDSNGTEANGPSRRPSISGDGNRVAFESTASNLVPNDTNGVSDVFVHDRSTGTTSRVSVASNGTQANGASQAPAISGDGTAVAFDSVATNLVANDTNNVSDVFLHDLTSGNTVRVSVNSAGDQGNGTSVEASISDDGTKIAFESDATNLAPDLTPDSNGNRDVFVHDRATGMTWIVSDAPASNTPGNGDAQSAAISGDGSFVAFLSGSTNLVGNDANGVIDVFIHGPLP